MYFALILFLNIFPTKQYNNMLCFMSNKVLLKVHLKLIINNFHHI